MTITEHYAAVSALGCIACKLMNFGFTPAELHHPWGRKGDNEMRVLPLCFQHHRSGFKNAMWCSVHPWRKEFISRYGRQESLLEQVNDMIANQE